MARLRAVETRRWMVRASGSGITAFIDPSGAITAALAVREVVALTREVERRAAETPYVRYGDWILSLSAMVFVARVALAWRPWR